MALTEVKRFIQYLNENRKALTEYNEKLMQSGSFLYPEPTFVSTGYYVSPMIPESIEDDLLQRIIELDEKSAHKLEKISKENGKKISLKNRLVRKFDKMMYRNENHEGRILSHEESKRHHLFKRLAELAKEDGFDISTDDLLYFVGKAVLVTITEHPDYNETQTFNEILKAFE